ncbi:hypothetical protein EYC80_010996 [Monilinia laxa]|uniref:2EXR domain-containing protein n=1 Tax=Monilinia laxa TaxID=61186 RepID=A0A5N6JPS8_MONLA|nr:hypothetical protein EYC80_010996 [Monilinia laxa]
MNEKRKYCYHCDYANIDIDISMDPKPDYCKNCRYYHDPVDSGWVSIAQRPEDFYDGENKDDNADSFICFNDLPPELRLKIWEFAMPGPRIVLLNYNGRTNEYRSLSQISMAAVCQESRHVVTSLYVKAFGTESAEPKTWFNFEIDTLYIQRYPWVVGGHPNGFLDRGKVRKLAVHILEPCRFEGNNSVRTEDTLHNLLSIFENVEVLINVQKRHNEPSQNQELELLDPINIDRLLAFSRLNVIREENITEQEKLQTDGYVPFDFASDWPIELGPDASNYVPQSELHKLLQVDNDLQSRTRLFRGQRAKVYLMPEIREMMITTSLMVAKIREAQKVYQKAEEAHKLLI